MRDITDLLPRVLVKAAACPEPLAIRAIRDAARTFLRRSRLWRLSDSYAIRSTRDCESISTGEHSAVYEFEQARFFGEDDEAGIILDPVTLAWLDTHIDNWRDEDSTPPRYITQTNPGTLRVAPKATGTLKLDVILEPREKAVALPDFLVERFPDIIANGALAEILTTPGDFANPQLALDCRRAFGMSLDEWGAKASRGQQRAPRRTRPASNF